MRTSAPAILSTGQEAEEAAVPDAEAPLGGPLPLPPPPPPSAAGPRVSCSPRHSVSRDSRSKGELAPAQGFV